MEDLDSDAARDQLLDDDNELVGLVKDVKEVEKRLRHKLLPLNAWRLILFFTFHVHTEGRAAPTVSFLYKYMHVCTSMYKYVQVYTNMYLPYYGMYQYVRVCTRTYLYVDYSRQVSGALW